MMETAWLSAFSGNVAALGLAAGAYLVYKLVRRLRCASHTQCCDVELVKPETQMEGPSLGTSGLSELIKALRNTKEPYEPWVANAIQVDHARRQEHKEGEVSSID